MSQNSSSRIQEKICLSQQDTMSQEPEKFEETDIPFDTSNIDNDDLHNIAFCSLVSVESTTSNLNISLTKRLTVEKLQPTHICPYSAANDDQSWLQGYECPGPIHVDGITFDEPPVKETPADISLPLDCDYIVAGSHLQEMRTRENELV